MTKIKASEIRELKDATGAPILRAKKVLEEVGDFKKALKILKEEGFQKASKRIERVTAQGIVATYAHHTGNVSSIVELLCETDFVARNDLFVKLADELALQTASMDPKNTKELLKQDFIKDPSKKIEDLVKEVIAKTGENIQVGRIARIEIGKK